MTELKKAVDFNVHSWQYHRLMARIASALIGDPAHPHSKHSKRRPGPGADAFDLGSVEQGHP